MLYMVGQIWFFCIYPCCSMSFHNILCSSYLSSIFYLECFSKLRAFVLVSCAFFRKVWKVVSEMWRAHVVTVACSHLWNSRIKIITCLLPLRHATTWTSLFSHEQHTSNKSESTSLPLPPKNKNNIYTWMGCSLAVPNNILGWMCLLNGLCSVCGENGKKVATAIIKSYYL